MVSHLCLSIQPWICHVAGRPSSVINGLYPASFQELLGSKSTQMIWHGVIHDSQLVVVLCFVVSMALSRQFCNASWPPNMFYVEMYAIVQVIEFATPKGRDCIWSESATHLQQPASTCLMSSSFKPPWQLRFRWFSCLSLIRGTHFTCLHNCASDLLEDAWGLLQISLQISDFIIFSPLFS